MPRKLPLPFLPETDPELVARTGNPPRIIAPAAGSTYEVLNSDSSRKQGVPLRAKTDADVREVYWFADKTFIGKSAATDILSWKSAPCRYELTALDDHWRFGSCTVTVR
jgi:membrane carboxypeptidase/penicillin-binding protein PbpC